MIGDSDDNVIPFRQSVDSSGVFELEGTEDDGFSEERLNYNKEYYEKKERESDYEYSRRILYDVISRGAEAVDDALRIAQQSEHPRAFEVLSKLIKDVGDTNDKLLGLQKLKKDIEKKDAPPALPGIAVGGEGEPVLITTSDLQKMLEGKIKTPEPKDITPKTEDD